MLPFSTIEPIRREPVEHVNLGAGDYYGSVLGLGWSRSLGTAITRGLEDSFLTGDQPEIDPEEANRVYGLPGLTFKEAIPEDRAKLIYLRRKNEIELETRLELGREGVFRNVAGFVGQIAGSILHPVDLAISFVPLFGAEAAGARAFRAGQSAARIRMARGLVATEEQLFKTFPRFGAVGSRYLGTATEATLGNLLTEPIVMAQSLRDLRDYNIEQFGLNIAGGAVAATALRGLLHTAARAVEAAGIIKRVTPETRVGILGKALDDAMNERNVDVGGQLRMDRNVIESKIRESEAEFRAEAERVIPPEEPKLQVEPLTARETAEIEELRTVRDITEEEASKLTQPQEARLKELETKEATYQAQKLPATEPEQVPGQSPNPAREQASATERAKRIEQYVDQKKAELRQKLEEPLPQSPLSQEAKTKTDYTDPDTTPAKLQEDVDTLKAELESRTDLDEAQLKEIQDTIKEMESVHKKVIGDQGVKLKNALIKTINCILNP